MNINKAELVISAASAKQYPINDFPEIAFVGHSNVGKSSLINKLLSRKNLARTSGQPGKTQTINFYNINDQIFFVDVPGYGFAKVSKAQREAFGVMIEEYITTRQQLKGVIYLVDSRHAPTEDDKLMYHWLDYYQIPILVIGTKIDKLSKARWNQAESLLKKSLEFKHQQELILFSAETGAGYQEVWDWINQKTNQ